MKLAEKYHRKTWEFQIGVLKQRLTQNLGEKLKEFWNIKK